MGKVFFFVCGGGLAVLPHLFDDCAAVTFISCGLECALRQFSLLCLLFVVSDAVTRELLALLLCGTLRDAGSLSLAARGVTSRSRHDGLRAPNHS